MNEETPAVGETISPSSDAPSARSGARPPGAFDRAMFAALIPAFLLPPIAVVAVWAGEQMRGFGDADLLALVIGFFMFIQLGSQVLNAWLVLRRPASVHTRALPRTLSFVNAISYGILILWSLVLFFLSETGWGVAFGGFLAILGVVALFTIIGARMRDASEAVSSLSSASHQAVGFSARARGFTWGYLVVATAGLIASAVLTIGQSAQDAALPPIAGIAAFVLVMLGLPWSHTLYGIVFLAIVLTASESQQFSGVLIVLALPVLANIAIAVILLVSPPRRERIVTWFFRLKPTLESMSKIDEAKGTTESDTES